MQKTLKIALVILAALLFLSGCAKEEEERVTEKASGRVDEITTEVADAAVKKIKTPINRAKMTRNLGDDRTEAMDKALQNQ